MSFIKKIFPLLIIPILLIAACSSNQAGNEQTSNNETASQNSSDGEKVLYVQIGGEVKNFDPHFATGLAEYATLIPMFNGLVRFPPGTVDVENIEGDLAEKWETNEDMTEWTFYLRKGVQWHKGYGELTAEDVKKSFERVMDVKNGISHGSRFSKVESIETPDE